MCICWLIIKVIIILRIKYKIITCISNDNNAVINNNYGKLQDRDLLIQIPLGPRPQKGLPALMQTCMHYVPHSTSVFIKTRKRGRFTQCFLCITQNVAALLLSASKFH